MGDRGFRIKGGGSVIAVSGAGDVDGDRRAYLLLGAPYVGSHGRESSGSAYLVFGKTSNDDVDLTTAADVTPPKLLLAGPTNAHVLHTKAVVVRASCDERCTLQAEGTIAIIGGTRFSLDPLSLELPVAGTRTLRLALPRSVQKLLAHALRQGRRARATVAVFWRIIRGSRVSARTDAVRGMCIASATSPK